MGFVNPKIDGNYYPHTRNINACSNLCSHHPSCSAWEYNSNQLCVLKSGTPRYEKNLDKKITTWAGLKTGSSGCITNHDRRKICPFGKYHWIKQPFGGVARKTYCLDCPSGKYTKTGDQSKCYSKKQLSAYRQELMSRPGTLHNFLHHTD